MTIRRFGPSGSLIKKNKVLEIIREVIMGRNEMGLCEGKGMRGVYKNLYSLC